MLKKDMHIGTAGSFVQTVKSIMEAEGNGNEFLFRGQSSLNYPLQPSIARNSNHLKHEKDMISLAKYRLPDVFTNSMTPMEILSLLQHYGVPTRLLDVTENALVALYFACQESQMHKNDDGIVYLFRNRHPNKSNHAILNAVADSSFILNFNDKDTVTLESFFDAMVEQSYWKTTSAANNKHIGGKAAYVEKHLKGTLFVNAPSFTIRQRIQQGKYILFPNDMKYDSDGKKSFTNTISAIDKDSDAIAGKIIISKDKKIKILKELTSLGVSEYSLFSDSIDIVCKGIRRSFEK